MLFTINENLEPRARRFGFRKGSVAELVAGKLPHNDPLLIPGKTIYERAKPDVVSCSFEDDAEAIQTESYTGLLRAAYSDHLTVAINPHDVWYTMLSQIAGVINEKPEAYRTLFSKSKEKQNVIVLTGDPTHLPLDSVINKLRELVPSNVDTFFPTFSTSTPNSTVACYAAFADAVKAYYNYMTMMCGIRAVDVKGTVEDWKKAVSHAHELSAVFSAFGGGVLSTYLNKVEKRLQEITASLEGGDSSFYRSIYTDKNIGSGGELSVDGWWVSDMFVADHKSKKLENVPHTLSVVPYKNLETGVEYSAIYGCFKGQVDAQNVVSSDYGHVVFRKPTDDVIKQANAARLADTEEKKRLNKW